jgi:hypothetical protein
MRHLSVGFAFALLLASSLNAFKPARLPTQFRQPTLGRFTPSMANIFENEPGDIPPPNAGAIGATGIVSSVVCFYSLYILKTTSCGLPPGPAGLLGAGEGISYLVVTFIFGWSLLKKIQTGSGLNTDDKGLLGLAEGLSFLVVIGGLVIAALNLNDYGFLPGFLPNDKCFGVND